MSKIDHISLNTFWPYQVTVLADQISRYTQTVIRDESDLNQSQWRVLAAVVDKPERTAAEVTIVTPMDKTIVSRAVNSLINDGLIKKTKDGADKRRHALTATPTGLEIYTRIATRLNVTLANPKIGDQTVQDFIKTLRGFSREIESLNPSSHK